MERKKFLQLAGSSLGVLALNNYANAISVFETEAKLKQFGIQLYGVRDTLNDNPGDVLKKLAGFGYKQIESFEHSKHGLYMGMGNKGFKTFVNDLGMTIPSVHSNAYINFEKNVESAAEIGVKYFIYNWEGPGKTLDDYKKMTEDFNKKGEFCNKHNIRFAFHNHDYTFKEVDGVLIQEMLLNNTEKKLVDFQIDLYWAITAGKDPVAHLLKYPDRYKLAHFKDRKTGTTERDGTAICELGTGSINFKNILKQIKKTDIAYYIVDQDTCNDRTNPLECARVDAQFMKNLKF